MPVQFEPIFQYKNVIPLIEARRKEDEKRKKLLTNLGGGLTGRSGLFLPSSNAHNFRQVPSSPFERSRWPGSHIGFPSLYSQRQRSEGHGEQSSPPQQRQRSNGQGEQSLPPQQRQRSNGQGEQSSPLQQRQRSEGQGEQSSPPQQRQRLDSQGTRPSPYQQRQRLDGQGTLCSPYHQRQRSDGQGTTRRIPVAVSLPPALLNSVFNARGGSLNIDLYSKRPQSKASLRAVVNGLQGNGSRSHNRYQRGISREGSRMSSADLPHRGHSKGCSSHEDLCAHNAEVREVGGLVCTARCSHHENKSCLYKFNFCQAASAYFPFDLYKWKKIESKTPEPKPKPKPTPTPKPKPKPKPSPTSNDTLAYVKLRSLLPQLKEGEQVLFKSPDDCWYYHGTVLQNCQNTLYVVTDVHGHQEKMWREDIIRQKDLKTNIKVGQVVLAEHPDYTLSYAPGKVMSVADDGMSVTMYDGTETVVTTAHVALAPAKHNTDVADIKAMAEQWVDETVLTRNKVGEYHLARVVGIAATPHHYKVAWHQSPGSSNSAEEEVNVVHLFGALTPVTPIEKNDYVLAPTQADKSSCYLPARVTETGENLKVMFVDKSTSDVAKAACFWISSSYYIDAASTYIHWRQKTSRSTR